MRNHASPRLETVKELNARTIGIAPPNPAIGAGISGVDLSAPISEEQFAEIRKALLVHHVLIFRDQHLTREDHKRFGRMFGPLYNESPRLDASITEQDREILVVKADQASRAVAGEDWHSGFMYYESPPLGSMLT
jgi:taurine dioxygenase